MLKNATRNITFIVLIIFSLASTYWYRDYVILKLEQFCQWVDSLGRIGYLILGLADLIGVVICFPFTIAFEIAAGFLFQFTYGVVLISLAKTCGACVAFLLGRTMLKSWIERKLAESETYSSVYSDMSEDTFKLAVLLRLSPIPSWVNNYGLALTPVTFRNFFLATFIAGLPFVAQNVYIGSLMNSFTVSVNETDQISWFKHVSLILAIVSTIIVSRYLYKYLANAMKNQKFQPDDLRHLAIVNKRM